MKDTKRVIAIDIDEVTADFISYFIYFHNLMYKTEITKEKVYDYYLHQVFDIDKDEMRVRFLEFQSFHLLERILPVEGAIEGIKKLAKRGYEIHFVTARPQTIEKETLTWFRKNFKNFDFPIHFTHADSSQPKKKKSEICKEIGTKILIDDNLYFGYECAENGITVYLMDAPWNQRDSLPENIIRVKSWKDILEKIN